MIDAALRLLFDLYRSLTEILSGFAAYIWDEFSDEFVYVATVLIAAIVRAVGVTVHTGQHALRFSFGRAGKVLEPGFHLLVPFLQVVRKIPTRSRTLNLPSQRVTNFEGLVYQVDANLVYRVVDVRKALIQIDDLVKGMLEMLGLGVQEVVRRAPFGGPVQYRLRGFRLALRRAEATRILVTGRAQ